MKRNGSRNAGAAHADEFTVISQKILRYANRGASRIDFLTEISTMLLDSSHCDALELRLKDPDRYYRWEFTDQPTRSSRFTVIDEHLQARIGVSEVKSQSDTLERLCRALIEGRRIHPKAPFLLTKRGSIWTRGQESSENDGRRIAGSAPYTSLALIRFTIDDRTVGLLQLKSLGKRRLTNRRVEFYEGIARIVGLAIANRQAQWALRERIKELTCLYKIGRVAQIRGVALDELLQRIAELLPPALQFPEIACARIVLYGRIITTPGFRQGPHRQSVDLIVQGSPQGFIEVVYTEHKLECAEEAFLAEEHNLLETVAREVAMLVERCKAEEDQIKLQAQLRHADRLATIGQLAAGVAHELNEPLGNVLGFAQLIQKAPGLPEETAADLAKIVKASLHAREVIHKLLVFSRQKTPVMAKVNLNRIVQEGLYFLESRCARAGIQVGLDLACSVPEIRADASQMHQVLVNLVVNSIQAMPNGGVLTIQTSADRDFVSLSVQDTGCGMTEEVKERIFMPFFTTKDVDQGTGLGLPVVHGIVTAHGGSILVESAPGKGAHFEVRLPRGAKSEGEQDD